MKAIRSRILLHITTKLRARCFGNRYAFNIRRFLVRTWLRNSKAWAETRITLCMHATIAGGQAHRPHHTVVQSCKAVTANTALTPTAELPRQSCQNHCGMNINHRVAYLMAMVVHIAAALQCRLQSAPSTALWGQPLGPCTRCPRVSLTVQKG
jgi:hypothetical protein